MKIGDCVRPHGQETVMVVKQFIEPGLVVVNWDCGKKAHEAVYAPFELDVVCSVDYKKLYQA